MLNRNMNYLLEVNSIQIYKQYIRERSARSKIRNRRDTHRKFLSSNWHMSMESHNSSSITPYLKQNFSILSSL